MSEFDRNDWDLDMGFMPERRPVENARGNNGRPVNPKRNVGTQYNPRNMYGQDTGMSSARKRRRKRQRIKRIILAIVLVLLIAGLIFGAVYILKSHVSTSAVKSKDEVYHRNIDLTDVVAGDMALWLSTLDDSSMDTAWVKEKCGEITVTSTLTLGKDENGDKTFTEVIDDGAYNSLSGSVDSSLSKILSEIIAIELVNEGYAESVSTEEAASLATQILGTDISSYVRENGVNIVPSIDILNDKYTLGSGTYEVSKGVATFNKNTGESFTENIINKKDSLVLINSGKVYELEDGKDE